MKLIQLLSKLSVLPIIFLALVACNEVDATDPEIDSVAVEKIDRNVDLDGEIGIDAGASPVEHKIGLSPVSRLDFNSGDDVRIAPNGLDNATANGTVDNSAVLNRSNIEESVDRTNHFHAVGF